jgi:hypothetical protein
VAQSQNGGGFDHPHFGPGHPYLAQRGMIFFSFFKSLKIKTKLNIYIYGSYVSYDVVIDMASKDGCRNF